MQNKIIKKIISLLCFIIIFISTQTNNLIGETDKEKVINKIENSITPLQDKIDELQWFIEGCNNAIQKISSSKAIDNGLSKEGALSDCYYLGMCAEEASKRGLRSGIVEIYKILPKNKQKNFLEQLTKILPESAITTIKNDLGLTS